MNFMDTRSRRIVNTTRLHQVNQKAIMDCLRLEGPLSSADLARHFSVPIGTISRLVERLIRLKMIAGRRASRNQVGKPPVILDINPEFGLLVGMEIGVSCTRLVLTDFKGVIRAGESLPTEGIRERPAEATAERLEAFRAEHAGRTVPLAGAGIGLSGVVDFESGRLLHGFLPAGTALNGPASEALKVPVLTDNDANLAVLGEHAFGAARGKLHVLGMLDRGWLGSGILIDGRLYRGAFHGAGELSALELADQEPASGEGVFATSFALEREIRRTRFQGVKPDAFWRRSDMLETLGKQAAGGDARARALVEGEAMRLAAILATLSYFMDPQMLVLCGDFAAAAPEGIRRLVEEFACRQKRPSGRGPALAVTSLGQNSVALGAVSMMIDVITQSRIRESA